VLALGLALGVAAAWGTADFLGGLTTRGLPVAVVIAVSQAFGLLVLGTVVAVVRPDVPGAAEIAWALLAGIAVAIGIGALYQGMARGVMSVVSPISATGAAIPIVYGLARGERPSAFQAAGVALALASVIVVSRGFGDGSRTTARTTGIGLALVAAAGFGTFFVAADLAAEGGVLAATLAQRLGLVVVVVGVLLATRPSLAVPRASLVPLIAIGLLDSTATGLYLAATNEGLASVVSVVASLYPAVTIGLAYVLLHERLSASQKTGAAGALAGVALMAAG
jgi:drug/metabolite transporter (DMT)-like permease